VRKVLLCGAAALALAACNPDDVVHQVGWFVTMRHQRSYKPYARPIPPVPGTVPIAGGELPVDLKSAEHLTNPRTRTSESINRGKFVYETYCQVCHGAGGRGDGPVSATAGGPFPAIRNLTDDVARKRSDGYLYGVLVNSTAMGKGLMPRYGDKIRGTDRWDVVNYVRSLQQAAAGGTR
jgi:mono/diheme cytochrome c family protein